MLIVTRRMGERIMIGEDVTVTILGVHGHQVRIGVEAPRGVAVHCEECASEITQDDVARNIESA